LREGKNNPITIIPNEIKWNIYRSPMPFGRYEINYGDVLKSWLENEIDIVVSTNPVSEFIEKSGRNRIKEIKKSGLDIIHFPINDRDVPIFSKLIRLIDKLVFELKQMKNIVIHCSAGIGRTGTIIACIIISSGKFSVDQALNLLFGLTPKIGPENEKQISIVRKYYQYHLSKNHVMSDCPRTWREVR